MAPYNHETEGHPPGLIQADYAYVSVIKFAEGCVVTVKFVLKFSCISSASTTAQAVQLLYEHHILRTLLLS